jgi:3-oxoacyl-[acyl-carrier-protein] synthase II
LPPAWNQEASVREEIVVTGLGVYCPLGKNVAAFRDSLVEGTKSYSRVDEMDTQGFRNDKAGIIKDVDPCESKTNSRISFLLNHAVREAVQDAGLQDASVEKSRVGISLGTSIGGYGGYVSWTLQNNGVRKYDTALNKHCVMGKDDLVRSISPIVLAYEIAERYGFTAGMATSVTACSAGSNSLAFAADFIRRGHADVVVAGGVDPINEISFMGFNALMVLSKGEPAPFCNRRSGILLGEGAACLVLEKESSARQRGARIYARLVGYGLSNDAYHVTKPHPQGDGACKAMMSALQDAGLEPDHIDYVNMHGTGTQGNDAMELTSLKRVFGERSARIPISSNKSLAGHSLGAAGSIEAVSSVLSLHSGFIPASLGFAEKIAGFDYDIVTTTRRDSGLRSVMSNSFGFGGNCASLIFGRVPEEEAA